MISPHRSAKFAIATLQPDGMGETPSERAGSQLRIAPICFESRFEIRVGAADERQRQHRSPAVSDGFSIRVNRMALFQLKLLA